MQCVLCILASAFCILSSVLVQFRLRSPGMNLAARHQDQAGGRDQERDRKRAQARTGRPLTGAQLKGRELGGQKV